jgi:hypothetical protein
VRAPRRFPAAVVAEGDDEGAGEPDGTGVGVTDAVGDGLGDGDAVAVGVAGGPNGCGALGPPPMTEQPPRMTAAVRIDEPRTS